MLLFALRHIGTNESFRLIFKAFLNVDILVSNSNKLVLLISR
nr:DUF735 family protein [Borreliella finlandensis]